MSGQVVSLAAEYDGLILDADGVIYRGPQPVAHAIEVLGPIIEAMPWCVLTNNAANAPSVVADKLCGLGLLSNVENVVTSPQGAVAYLESTGVAAGAHVLVVGGAGIEDALRVEGFVPSRDRHDDVVAVVQGFGPAVGWRDLAEASYAIADGAMWVATNLDRNIPTEFGFAPGNGTLVAAVSAAVGRSPDAVTGKPEPLLFELAAERMSSSRPLVVGDRLDTDIRGGNRAGMDTLLVLTGVTGHAQLSELCDAPKEDRPTYLAHDLRALQRPASQSRILGSEGLGDTSGLGDIEGFGDTSGREDTDGLADIRRMLARAWAD